MKIEVTTSVGLKSQILDLFKNHNTVVDFQNQAKEWAEKLTEEAIKELLDKRKYFEGQEITFAVSLSFDNEIIDEL